MEIAYKRIEFGVYSYYFIHDMDAEKLALLKKNKPHLNFFESNVAWGYNGAEMN